MVYKAVTPFTLSPGNYAIMTWGYVHDQFRHEGTSDGTIVPDSSGLITLTGGGAVNTSATTGNAFPSDDGHETIAFPYAGPSFQFNASAPIPSFTLNPTTATTGSNQTITATGTNTTWVNGTTTFSVAGGTGASISGLSISGQVAIFTLHPGNSTGSLTISDSTDSATSSITVSSSSSPLAIGALTLSAVDNSGITLSWSAATGGTLPYTYTLYRYASAPFTPPGTGTLVYSGTGTTTKDSTALPGSPSFYRLYVTDSASGNATSTQDANVTSLISETHTSPLVFGFVGDSITAGTGASSNATRYAQILANMVQAVYPEKNVTINDQGVSGTTSTDWVNSTNGANLSSAISSFQSSGVTHVFVMLGTNDAKTSVNTSSNTYLANMTLVVNSLVAGGFKVFIAGSPYIIPGSYSQWNEASNSVLLGYRSQLSTLVALGSVYLDSMQLFELFMTNTGYFADGVHPNDAGHAALGQARAGGFLSAISMGAYPTTSQIATAVVAAMASAPVGSVASPVSLSMAQSVPVANATATVGESLAAARAEAMGSITYDPIGKTFKVYASDGTTVLKSFTVTTDANGNILGRE